MIAAKREWLGFIFFMLWGGAAYAQTAQQEIQISALVTGTCTINGGSTGTVDTATIPINGSGNVVTTPITPTNSPYASVVCNSPSTIQLRSANGAVKNSTVVSGLTNIIDYQASATWNAQTATIDTATNPAASGQETGTAQPVGAGSGDLSVSITPVANSAPLVSGSYTDSLFVVLTPN